MEIPRGTDGGASRRFAEALRREAVGGGLSQCVVYAALGVMFATGRGARELRPHADGLSRRAGISANDFAAALDVIERADRGLAMSVASNPEPEKAQHDTAAAMVAAVDDVFAAYNEAAQRCGWVVASRSDRVARDAVVAALSDFGFKGVMIAIEKAAGAKFLCNRGRGWRPTLAWLAKPDTILKIDEGFYADEQRSYRK